MYMYSVFKKVKSNPSDLWMDADLEAVDLLPDKKQARLLKDQLNKQNNQPKLVKYVMRTERI